VLYVVTSGGNLEILVKLKEVKKKEGYFEECCKSSKSIDCLVTNILLNISICVHQKEEIMMTEPLLKLLSPFFTLNYCEINAIKL